MANPAPIASITLGRKRPGRSGPGQGSEHRQRRAGGEYPWDTSSVVNVVPAADGVTFMISATPRV
jgi:hypothetical protein